MHHRRSFLLSLLAVPLPLLGVASVLIASAEVAGCSGSSSATGGGSSSGGGTPTDSCPSGMATVATDVESPGGMAIDANNVYWTSPLAGLVLSVPRCGGSVSTLASIPGAYPAAIAIDSTHAYFTAPSDNAVMKVPLVGGAPTTLASNQTSPINIATNGTTVYWLASGFSQTGALLSVPVAGGAPTTLAAAPDSEAQLRGLTLDATYVYWTNEGDPGSENGAILRMPLGGGAITTIAAPAGDPAAITVDSTYAYVEYQDGHVLRVGLTGGPTLQYADNLNNAGWIALVGGTVYYTNDWLSMATLYSVPASGGVPVTLARLAGSFAGVVASEASVFWALAGTGNDAATSGTITRLTQ
jgi:hypothetical protein